MQNNQQQNIESLYVPEYEFKIDDYREKSFIEIFLWILSFGIWGCCIGGIFTVTAFGIALACYIVYLFVEFCCTKKLKAFSNKKSISEMNEIMSSWFKAVPVIKFICEVYEERIVENNERSEQIYELKNRDTKYFNFISSRDVSGPIIFQNEYYSYICFIPIPEIKFADTITYSDYK